MDTKKRNIVLTALKKTGGNVSHACEQAGISRAGFYLEKQNNPDFAKEVEDIQEGVIDLVETALMKEIQNGNTACIIFFLKTKGKDRGYVERSEIDHRGKDGGAIQFDSISLEKKLAALAILEQDGQ
jgi:hypothetical protein